MTKRKMIERNNILYYQNHLLDRLLTGIITAKQYLAEEKKLNNLVPEFWQRGE